MKMGYPMLYPCVGLCVIWWKREELRAGLYTQLLGDMFSTFGVEYRDLWCLGLFKVDESGMGSVDVWIS